MATVYRRVGGKKLTQAIAELDGVQADLEARTFEMAVRAEELLLEHRQEGHAAIEIEHGDIDWYVVLSDMRGQKAAMSIEYGRQAGTYEIRDERTGQLVERTFGAMDGLFILAQATNLPKKRKGKVKLT